jgi:hypothetical protein
MRVQQGFIRNLLYVFVEFQIIIYCNTKVAIQVNIRQITFSQLYMLSEG